MTKFSSLLYAGVSAFTLTCLAGSATAANVASESELSGALQTGTDITFIGDVSLTGNLPEATAGTFTINGNSHSLSGPLVLNPDSETEDPSAGGFVFGADVTANIENLNVSNLKQAVVNNGTINSISNSVFEGNAAITNGETAAGGAIGNHGTIGEISNSEFRGNWALGQDGSAYGGAIANMTTNALNLVNTSFYDNYVEVTGESAVGTEETSPTSFAYGGAIYSKGDVNITAQGQDVVFSGNKVYAPDGESAEEGGDAGGEDAGGEDTGGEDTSTSSMVDNVAIVLEGSSLNLTTDAGGRIIFDDSIESVGETYGNLSVRGEGEVIFNSTVSGIENFIFDNSTITLGNVEAALNVGNFQASGSPILNVTVDPDTLSAGQIRVDSDVIGTTRVVVHATSEKVLDANQSILFVEAANDDKETAGDFVVYRVFGSPYMWSSTYHESTSSADGTEDNAGGEGEILEPTYGSSGWYLSMTGEANPDYRPMAPEIAAYMALHSAAVEQNRDIVSNVRRSVANNKFMLKRFNLLYEDDYKGKAVSNLWVNPVYRYVQVNAPQEWEASIAGFDAGLDLQSDASNKFGVFAAYRYGTYDIGKKGYFTADLDSQIEISSTLFGLYYRYDYDRFWSFASAYVGNQHAEIETDDGIRADADGTQYGAGVEMGYAFIPGYNWTLEPSLGVFYTGIDYDDMDDKYGKTADYSMLHQIEGEFGLKLEKTIDHEYGYSKFYIKPSVIQTINFGNEVKISTLGEADTLDDQTLGRIELGGRYALDAKMNMYGYVNYTTGSDYDDIAAGLGFSYRWY